MRGEPLKLCVQAHPPFWYPGERCPFCVALAAVHDLASRVQALQDELQQARTQAQRAVPHA
jgi:hypothetical protein